MFCIELSLTYAYKQLTKATQLMCLGCGRKRRHSPEYNSGKGGANKEGDGDPDDMASFLAAKRAKKNDDGNIMTRTGGAYIPPARLRMMQQQIEDKTSAEYQRLSWEALKKSIMGLVNKINVANIAHIVRELFQENIVRGRWVLHCQHS